MLHSCICGLKQQTLLVPRATRDVEIYYCFPRKISTEDVELATRFEMHKETVCDNVVVEMVDLISVGALVLYLYRSGDNE